MGKQPRCSSTRGLSRLAIPTVRTQSHAKLLSAYRQVAVYCFSHTASEGRDSDRKRQKGDTERKEAICGRPQLNR